MAASLKRIVERMGCGSAAHAAPALSPTPFPRVMYMLCTSTCKQEADEDDEKNERKKGKKAECRRREEVTTQGAASASSMTSRSESVLRRRASRPPALVLIAPPSAAPLFLDFTAAARSGCLCCLCWALCRRLEGLLSRLQLLLRQQPITERLLRSAPPTSAVGKRKERPSGAVCAAAACLQQLRVSSRLAVRTLSRQAIAGGDAGAAQAADAGSLVVDGHTQQFMQHGCDHIAAITTLSATPTGPARTLFSHSSPSADCACPRACSTGTYPSR